MRGLILIANKHHGFLICKHEETKIYVQTGNVNLVNGRKKVTIQPIDTDYPMLIDYMNARYYNPEFQQKIFFQTKELIKRKFNG